MIDYAQMRKQEIQRKSIISIRLQRTRKEFSENTIHNKRQSAFEQLDDFFKYVGPQKDLIFESMI